MPKFTEGILDSVANGPKMLLTTITMLNNIDNPCWKHVSSNKMTQLLYRREAKSVKDSDEKKSN